MANNPSVTGTVTGTDASDHALAAALVGTQSRPPHLGRMRELASQARAYHALAPYPTWAFRNWKAESKGPLPVCMPVARRVVKQSAQWTLGEPARLMCPGNTAWETFLREAWAANAMDSRAPALGETGGLEGGVVLKFAYDSLKAPALAIQTLSALDEVRLYPHPHRRSTLLMARVQYPYQDPVDGRTWWYREEWTQWEEVHYHPVRDEGFGQSRRPFDPDTHAGWEESSREPNRLGVIPLVYVRNLETDDFWGGADLWNLAEGDGLYRVLDRINLARYIQDRNNQYPYEPWLLDAQLDEEDAGRENPPGAPVVVETTDDAEDRQKQGRIEFAPTGAQQHESLTSYIADLTREFEVAASSVDVDPGAFTNKGNMTRAVLEQLYLPLIQQVGRKRRCYGQDGFCRFFDVVARGLAALGVPGLGIDVARPETYAVELRWPEMFPLSEEEKSSVVGRVQEEELAGYLTHDRAIEAVARLEGVEDAEQLKAELAKEPRPSPNENREADPKAGEGDTGDQEDDQ